MGQVILLILKILGIVTGSLVGLVLLVTALILFVPVRYKVVGKKQDELLVHGEFHWLFRIFTLPIHYEKKETTAKLRFLGHVIKDFMAKGPENSSEKKKKTTKQAKKKTPSKNVKTTSKKTPVTDQKAVEKTETKPEQQTEAKPVLNAEAKPKQSTESQKKQKTSIFSRIREKLKKLKYTKDSFCDKIKQTKTKVGSIREFLLLESTKYALGTCFGELIFLLSKLKPRRIRGYVHFGFDDPALTGQVLGALGVVGGSVPRKLAVYPDFEQPVLDFDVVMRGRIHVVTLVLILIRLYRDQNIRTAYKRIKKGF